MTRARKGVDAKHAPGSRERGHGVAGDILRLLFAAGLLAVVVAVTMNGRSAVSKESAKARLDERLVLTRAVAASLTDELESARQAARMAAGGDPGGSADRDTFRVDQTGHFSSASGVSGPATSHPCGAVAGLADIVAAASASPSPVVMMLSPPGPCDGPIIGAAARFAGGTAVVTRSLDDVLGHVTVAAYLPKEIRTFVIDPGGVLVNAKHPAATAVPAYLAPFVSRALSGEGASARLTDAENTQVVEAGAPAAGGEWSVVLEQSTETFDAGRAPWISKTVLVTVGGLFAVVLLLQALSDADRRRAARRADARAAAFLAVLGHELRTPLTVIKGFIDTLTSRWGHLDDSQRLQLVERLPQQSRRLSRVVERLLLTANMQAGSAPRAKVGHVEVAPALERVAGEYRPLAPLHSFVVVASPDIGVKADAKAFEQILDQLVDNAIKYSPYGGLVRLAAVARRGQVEIVVEDEGIGLPPKTRSLFDPFVQGENVDSRLHDEGGVGVGLYIVRTLAEQVGGSVRAERRNEGGSRFVVTMRSSVERKATRTSATRHQ